MKKLKRLDTRDRAILSVVVIGLMIFFILSPISKFVFELLLPPSQLNNISISQRQRELDIQWDRGVEDDFKGYYISVNGERLSDPKLNNRDVDNFQIYDLDMGVEYLIEVGIEDNFSNISKIAQNVSMREQNTTYLLNERDLVSSNTIQVAMLAIFISLVSFLLTNWVLFFRASGKRLFTIAAFPSIALVPASVLSYSLFLTIENNGLKFLYALGVAILYVFVSYFLILTANILNGARVHGQIPLEQAAKASQFIVGLISTYLILIYTFSSSFNPLLKLIIVAMFVYYFTYSSLSSVKELSEQNILLRSLSVTLVTLVAMLAIFIWPVESIYSILVVAIVYYIVFNIVLEIRGNVGRSLWIEYGVLILLITLLLATNSVWGINGTLI